MSKEKITDVLRDDYINDIDIDMDMDMDIDIDVNEVKKTKKMDIEKESKKEIGESLKKIRGNEKKWKERIKIEIDGSFYFSVVFDSSEKKEKFLRDYGIELTRNSYTFEENLRDVLDK